MNRVRYIAMNVLPAPGQGEVPIGPLRVSPHPFVPGGIRFLPPFSSSWSVQAYDDDCFKIDVHEADSAHLTMFIMIMCKGRRPGRLKRLTTGRRRVTSAGRVAKGVRCLRAAVLRSAAFILLTDALFLGWSF